MRLSVGLACLTMSICLAAQSLGLVPDTERATLDGRRALCEAITIQCALAAQKEDVNTLRTVIEALVARNPQVVSAVVRRTNGKVLASAGVVGREQAPSETEISAVDRVIVPIRQGKNLWGSVEIQFQTPASAGWMSARVDSMLRLATFVSLAGFLTYTWYLKRTLTHLDPSAVIPDRVRATLDTLVEGVLVLDKEQRIVLANKAFAQNTGRSVDTLQGARAEQIPWQAVEAESGADFPWSRAIRDGVSQTGCMLRLGDGQANQRTFMVNSMPILGAGGSQRGALATFDDVTSVEKKNQQLQEMLTALKDSRDEIHKKNEELTLLASRDPLTSCLNRRAFYNLFEAQWATARAGDGPLACIMLDIDHFKMVNDTHGHSTGDLVLQHVAKIVRQTAQAEDVVCRYGGEEFCVLLPQARLDEALAFAERLRMTIAEEKCGELSVTCSVGVSCIELGAANPRELLEQADKSLYFSKRNGRNRVTPWSLVPQNFELRGSDTGRTKRSREIDTDVAIPFHAVTALTSALAYRDAMTAEHSRRVADLCVATARGLISESECYVLEVAALLHDIGKLGVPDAILLKPGPLNEEEWKVMSTHDRIGVEIISAAFSSEGLTSIVRTHHSWYGGNPRAPALPTGDEIPLGARILAIADAYDAMVSDRVYRKGRRREDAFEELRHCAGQQFDPALVERFVEAVSSDDQSRSHPLLSVGKPTALRIGLQMERLAAALDARDFPALSAMAGRLATTATKDGVAEIAELALELEKCTQGEPDLMDTVALTTELLELCRSTQAAYLDMHLEPECEACV